MSHRSRIRAVSTPLLLLLLACSQDAPLDGSGASDGPWQQSVTDSAGVRIVEGGPLAQLSWQAGAPVFEVGWDPDDPTFTWIQSGRILSDGGALLGDYGSGALYRLGPDGEVLSTWGGKGGGPGEYQRLDGIVLRGDTVIVSDGEQQRMTMLSPVGAVLHTTPLSGGFFHQASSVLSDGRVLLVPSVGYAGVSDMRPEWVFEHQPVLAFSVSDETSDTLAMVPHLRRWYGSRGAGPGPVSVRGEAAGFQGGFAAARADEPAVRWYDPAGRVTQIVRWAEEARPLTAEWKQQYTASMEEALRAGGMDEARAARQLQELQEGFDRHDGPLPFWGAFHVDEVGNAWLQQYSRPMDRPTGWRVISREGDAGGWVDLPDVVQILDITDDHVLAVSFDESDVPAAVMIPLTKLAG